MTKIQQFSATEALAEVEFQERLFRALQRELSRMSRESDSTERTQGQSPDPWGAAEAGTKNATPDHPEENISCESQDS